MVLFLCCFCFAATIPVCGSQKTCRQPSECCLDLLKMATTMPLRKTNVAAKHAPASFLAMTSAQSTTNPMLQMCAQLLKQMSSQKGQVPLNIQYTQTRAPAQPALTDATGDSQSMVAAPKTVESNCALMPFASTETEAQIGAEQKASTVISSPHGLWQLSRNTSCQHVVRHHCVKFKGASIWTK